MANNRNYYTDDRWYRQYHPEPGNQQHHLPYSNRQPYGNNFSQSRNIHMPRQPPPSNSYHALYLPPYPMARDRWNWRTQYQEIPPSRKKTYLDDVYGPNFEDLTENNTRRCRNKRSERQSYRKNVPQTISRMEEKQDVNESQSDTKKSVTEKVMNLPAEEVASKSAKVDTNDRLLQNPSAAGTCSNTEDLPNIISANKSSSHQSKSVRNPSLPSNVTSSICDEETQKNLTCNGKLKGPHNDILDLEGEESHSTRKYELQADDNADMSLQCNEDSTIKMNNCDESSQIVDENMEKFVTQSSSQRKTNNAIDNATEKSIMAQRECSKGKYHKSSTNTDNNLDTHSKVPPKSNTISNHQKYQKISSGKHNDSKSENKQLKRDDVLTVAVPSSMSNKKTTMTEYGEETICLDKVETTKSHLPKCPTDTVNDCPTPQKKRKVDASNKTDKSHLRRNSELSKSSIDEMKQSDTTIKRRASLDSQMEKSVEIKKKLESKLLALNSEHEGFSSANQNTSNSVTKKSSKHFKIRGTENTFSKRPTDKKGNIKEARAKILIKGGSDFKIPKMHSEIQKPTFSDPREQFRNGIKHIITPNKLKYLFGSDGSDDEQKSENDKTADRVSEKCGVGANESLTANVNLELPKLLESKMETKNKLDKQLRKTDLIASDTSLGKLKIGKSIEREEKYEGKGTLSPSRQDSKEKNHSSRKRHNISSIKFEKISSKTEQTAISYCDPEAIFSKKVVKKFIGIDVLKQKALNKERQMYIDMSFKNSLSNRNSTISIAIKDTSKSTVLPDGITGSEKLSHEATISDGNCTESAILGIQMDDRSIDVKITVQKTEHETHASIESLQLVCTGVKSELILPLMKCGCLAAFKLPEFHQANLEDISSECSEVATKADPPEIKEGVEIVKKSIDSSDDIVEIKQNIPIIDLTKDGNEIIAENFDSTEADLIRVLEETDRKDFEKITLYRSEETLNNSLEIQAMSACLTSVLESPSELKSDTQDIVTASQNLESTSSGPATSEISLPDMSNSSVATSITMNQFEKQKNSECVVESPEINISQNTDLSAKSNEIPVRLSASSSSLKESNAGDGTDALDILIRKSLSDSGTDKSNPEPADLRKSQQAIVSSSSQKKMEAKRGNKAVNSSNNVSSTKNSKRFQTHHSVTNDESWQDRELESELPISKRTASMDPDLSAQEYSLSGVMVPYALFVISLKQVHQYYFENLKKEMPYVPNLLKTEISLQLRVFSKKLIFYGNLMCTDLKNLNISRTMLTSTAQFTLKWIFRTIKRYKPNSSMTSVVVSLYQLMQPHRSFFLGDSYLRTFYNVLSVNYEKLCGRLQAPTSSSVYLSANQRDLLISQIQQYHTLVITNSHVSNRPSTNQHQQKSTKKTDPTKVISQNPSLRSLQNVVNMFPDCRLSVGKQTRCSPNERTTFTQCSPDSSAPETQSTAYRNLTFRLPGVTHPPPPPRSAPVNISGAKTLVRIAPKPTPAPILKECSFTAFHNASSTAIREFRNHNFVAPMPPPTSISNSGNSKHRVHSVESKKPKRSVSSSCTVEARDVHQDTPFHVPSDFVAPLSLPTLPSSVNSKNIAYKPVKGSLCSTSPNSSRCTIEARDVHQDTPFHVPSEFEVPTSWHSSIPNLNKNLESTVTENSVKDKSPPTILRNLDHIKSPVYAPMLFSPPVYEQDDSSLEPSTEPEGILETIDLTWIDEVDDEEIQKEMKFVVKKEKPNDDEVILNQEQFPVAEGRELIYIDRRCICEKTAVYLCKCRTVMYCSAPCQEEDWRFHKSACQKYAMKE